MEPNYRYVIVNLINKASLPEFCILENLYRLLFDLAFKTSNLNLYQIKLQWYLEAGQSKEMCGVPVVDNFKKLAATYNFLSQDVAKFITSYNINADAIPFQSVAMLNEYAKNTEGLLWKFYMQICQVNNPKVLALIEEIGGVYGAVGVIRNANFYESYSRFVLAFKQEDLDNNIKTTGQKNLDDLLFHLQKLCHDLLAQKHMLPPAIKPILLLLTMAQSYLKQVQQIGFKPAKIAKIQLLKGDRFKIFCKILWRAY